MKQLASKTYYQQKQAALIASQQESEEEFARLSPIDKQAKEQRLQALLADSKKKWQAAVYRKSIFSRWKFRRAIRLALSVAAHYEMDVTAEADALMGVITLVTDQFLSDTDWRDGQYRRGLLRLLRGANGVSIAGAEDETVQIILDYPLARAASRKRS